MKPEITLFIKSPLLCIVQYLFNFFLHIAQIAAPVPDGHSNTLSGNLRKKEVRDIPVALDDQPILLPALVAHRLTHDQQ